MLTNTEPKLNLRTLQPGKIIHDLLISLVIFLPSTKYFNIEFYLAFIPFIIFRFVTNKESFIEELKERNFKFSIFLALCAFVNRLIDIIPDGNIQEIYSNLYLLPFIYLVAKLINENILKLVVYFLCIEILLGICQYFFGVSSFDTSLPFYREFINYDLYYFTRVFGFGSNSSLLAIKSFGALLICNYTFRKPSLLKSFAILLILTGIVISFNRTVVIATLIYLCLYIGFLIYKSGWKAILNNGNIARVLFLLFFFHNPINLFNQITRKLDESSLNKINYLSPNLLSENSSSNKNKEITDDILTKEGKRTINVVSAGRIAIWKQFAGFIKSKPFTGNNSKAIRLNGRHAHNAYIQFLAQHGIVIGLVMFIFIASNISKSNMWLVFPVFIICISQYAIFWGVSFLDIIFYHFLFSNKAKYFPFIR